MKREKVLDVCPYYYQGSRRYGEQHLVSVPARGEEVTTKRETRLHMQTPPSSDLEHLEILFHTQNRNMKDCYEGKSKRMTTPSYRQREAYTDKFPNDNEQNFFIFF